MKSLTSSGIVQQALQEYLASDRSSKEPSFEDELEDERARREELERRVDELVEDNRRTRHKGSI